YYAHYLDLHSFPTRRSSDLDQKTLDLYGIGKHETDSFGRRCLLARKLVQAGVRFVQLFEAGWDSHDYLERAHTQRIKSIDQPIRSEEHTSELQSLRHLVCRL